MTRDRRNVVFQQMYRNDFITKEERIPSSNCL